MRVEADARTPTAEAGSPRREFSSVPVGSVSGRYANAAAVGSSRLRAAVVTRIVHADEVAGAFLVCLYE
jgi:hypothetical protein